MPGRHPFAAAGKPSRAIFMRGHLPCRRLQVAVGCGPLLPPVPPSSRHGLPMPLATVVTPRGDRARFGGALTASSPARRHAFMRPMRPCQQPSRLLEAACCTVHCTQGQSCRLLLQSLIGNFKLNGRPPATPSRRRYFSQNFSVLIFKLTRNAVDYCRSFVLF